MAKREVDLYARLLNYINALERVLAIAKTLDDAPQKLKDAVRKADEER